MDDLAVSC